MPLKYARDLLSPMIQRLKRGPRKLWSHGARTHIELRELSADELGTLAAELEHSLAALPGVAWARVNPYLGCVVVEHDPERTEQELLVRTVEDIETRLGVTERPFQVRDPEQHPGDPAPLERAKLAFAADAASLVLGLGMRAVQFPTTTPLQTDLAALVTLADGVPSVRKKLERALSIASTELGLGLVRSALQAVMQGATGPVAGMLQRRLRLRELAARQALWKQYEPELCAKPECHPGGAHPAKVPRPPRHQGPVERYTQSASAASVGLFGIAALSTRSLEQATGAIFGLIPRQARQGRDAFAAELGVRLASRGILAMDPHALRKLDRVDVAVIDGELLAPAHAEAHALVAAVRRAGLILAVCTSTPDRVAWAQADELSARPAADMVRSFQQGGLRVVLVASGPALALAAADCGLGIMAPGAPPPWGAHVFCRSGISDAIFVIEAIPAAQKASRESVMASMAEAGVCAAISLSGLGSNTTRRIMATANIAAIVSVLNAVRLARRLGPPESTATKAGSGDSHNSDSHNSDNRSRESRGSDGRSSDSGDPEAPPWHTESTEAVLSHLGSRPEGLTAAEATERRRPRPRPPSPLVLFGRMMVDELVNPIAPVLAVGAGLSALTGAVVDAALITGVVVANGAFGAVQRYRTDRAIARLANSEQYMVHVRRAASGTQLIASDALVPGDVIELEAGDVVPADCRILEAVALEVDESSLTGESLPVIKGAAPCPQAVAVADRKSMLYDGTAIAAGRTTAVVVAVGEDTEARRAYALADEPPTVSGVDRRLGRLTAVTAPMAAVGGLILTGAGLMRQRPLREVINVGVGLAVAAVPEGLPILATLAQVAAAGRLSKQGALVRNPRAVEALGRVNVLCADKTGTLTEGRICLQLVSDGSGAGSGDGAGSGEQRLEDLTDSHRHILAVALRASPDTSNGEILPHMTDRALVDGARRAEVTTHEHSASWQRVAELPFEHSRGYHAVLADHSGTRWISVKGAPELIVPRCRHWRRTMHHMGHGIDGTAGTGHHLHQPGDEVVELTEEQHAALIAHCMGLARRGFRVLAVAEKPVSAPDLGQGAGAGRPASLDDSDIQDLWFCGFVAFSDPVRPSARTAVRNLESAGVAVVMVTGDHPSTAEAIAVELGLKNTDRVITGPELEGLSDEELAELVTRTSVFARVTPVQKVRIVRAFKHAGRVVAMTGDGANDAPAIRLADVGIALGEGATPAARHSADMVVTDERIETIVAAVLEGRAMWTSVRDAVSMLVGGNIGELLFVVTGGLVAGQSPFNARQLLLVNLLTDSLPALAVALRHPEGKTPEELASEGPDASLGKALYRDIAWRAGITASATTIAWLAARLTGAAGNASTVALVALTGTQLTQTLVMGNRSTAVWSTGLGSLAALLGIVETPGISHFFGCQPLGPIGLMQAAMATALGTGAAMVCARLSKPHAQPGGPPAIQQSGTPAPQTPSGHSAQGTQAAGELEDLQDLRSRSD